MDRVGYTPNGIGGDFFSTGKTFLPRRPGTESQFSRSDSHENLAAMTGLDLESFLLLLRADLSTWTVVGLATLGLAFLVWSCWGSRRDASEMPGAIAGGSPGDGPVRKHRPRCPLGGQPGSPVQRRPRPYSQDSRLTARRVDSPSNARLHEAGDGDAAGGNRSVIGAPRPAGPGGRTSGAQRRGTPH